MTIDGGSVEVRFEGDLTSFRRSVEEAVELTEEVSASAQKVDGSVSDSMEEMASNADKSFSQLSDSAGEAFSKVVDGADEAVASVKTISQTLASIGSTVLTAGLTSAVGGLVSLVKKGVQATDFLETSRVAMSGLTGSVQEGNKAMSIAANYWQNNPFQRIDVTNATKQLVQFGRTTNDIAGDLEILGNVSLSTGMEIDDLARYYARVSSSGRAMTMDLEMMSDRGVPIYRELTKALNTTTEGVRKMASQGKIDFETFRKAMEGAVDPEAMKQYEETLARQRDRFKGTIQILAGELAGYKVINNELIISENGLEKAWTRLLKTLSDSMRSDSMKQAMQSLGQVLAKLVDTITKYAEPAIKLLGKALQFLGDHSALLVPLLGFLVTKISGFASQIPMIGGVISKLGGNFGSLFENLKKFVTLNPVLTAFVTIFGVGFAKALKNSEEFRNTFKNIGASLQTILNNLMEAFSGIFQTISQVVQSLAESGVIQGILQGVATALEVIAKAIASIPPEVLASLISFFVSMKLLKANPIYLVATGIALLIGKIKELGGIGKVLERVPEMLNTIGHNMMTGLVKGIQEGASKVLQFVKDVAKGIVNTFKTILGIHSPSTVMYGIGENITLGLANGIEDSSSAVQVAMNNLAKDILSLGEKVIGNKVDFGILDVNGQYKEWKKLSKLFTQGSEQYNYAVQKMEDVRKQANLKILDLQNSYNEALDETIDKIANMYGLFDEVNLSNSTNSNKILKTLDQQVAKMQEWAEAQEIIANSSLDAGLIEELQEMGVSSTAELSAIANMTADELSTLNEMWLKKQSIANDAGVKQMKNLKDETLDQIDKLKDGIDGATVDVVDVGGRLVSNIAEGVYGAMPTLESAFSQLGNYIAKAQRELAKSGTSTSETGTNVPDAGDTTENILKDTLEEMTGKVKDMLPNILLGIVGAIGAKWLIGKVANKLAGKGSEFAQSLAGVLFKGSMNKSDLSTLLGKLPYSDEGFLAKIVGKMQAKLEKSSSEVAEAVSKTASKVSKTSKPVESIATSSTSISKGMETTSKSMSKVDSSLNTIIKGAGAIIAIAAAIAAMAGALWLTYNALKDVDFKKLTGQLAMMGLAVAEFGGLAWAADELVGISLKSILIVAGIAADIAVVALACRYAYDTMKDIPWDGFASVLGQMGSALVVFGVLNGILGIPVVAMAEALGLLVSAGIMLEIIGLSKSCKEAYDTMKDMNWETFGRELEMMASALTVMGMLNAPLGAMILLEALGWASVSIICDELVKVAKALVVVNNNIPEDFGSLEKKLGHIKTTLEKINGLDLGTVIGMMVTSWSAGPVERIISMYAYVAEQLNKIASIELNGQKINDNLDYIKSILETIDAKTDVISGWLEASALDMEASSVENAGRIVTTYGDMVDALDKLANFEPDEAGITRSLTQMAGVVAMLRNQSYGRGGIFNIFSNMDTVANDVEKIKSIVKNYLEMVPTMQDLNKDENKISDSIKTTVQKNIDNIKDIVTNIGKVDTAGWIDQKESDVGKIQSILNKFTELEPVMYQVSQFRMSYTDNAKTNIGKIRDLVKEIGKVDTAGWIDQKESDMGKIQSILNKFTELAQTTHHFGKENYSVADNAITWIQKVRNMVWEIGQINQSEAGSLDAKADIIEKSKTIATKLKEFSSLFKDFESTDNSGLIKSLTDSLYQLTSSVQNTLGEQASGFENVGSQLGQSLTNGVNSQTEAMTNAGNTLQGSLWSALENRMADEFYQGRSMAEKFGEGLASVDMSNAGSAIQSSVWWGIQNKMNDEYYQGRSMGETFRQGLYDIDYGNAGWWAVQGFINGAWSKAGSNEGVYNTGRWIAERFLQGLKDRGEQGSPWKTTIESGNWAVEGLIEGIKEEEDTLVTEATNLADEVVSALTMDDLTMSPTLDATTLAPSMGSGEYSISGSGSGNNVTINQDITNYTPYDVETVSRDLSWQLSTI